MNATKPGIKTSEFWISFLVTVTGSLLATGVLGEGDVSKVAGAILAAFSVLGYGVSRGMVKKG